MAFGVLSFAGVGQRHAINGHLWKVVEVDRKITLEREPWDVSCTKLVGFLNINRAVSCCATVKKSTRGFGAIGSLQWRRRAFDR